MPKDSLPRDIAAKAARDPDGFALANCIRALSIDAVEAAASGHPGAPMGMADAATALLGSKARATHISPFVGRLDDLNIDGMELIREIREIYDNYGFETQILAASIRSANHVKEAALAGADVAKIPASVIKGLASHALTDKGLDQFAGDWAATGQSIL